MSDCWSPKKSTKTISHSNKDPWLIIFIFTLAAFIHGIQAFGYVAVPEITKGYYQTNMKGVTWTDMGLTPF